MISEQRKRAHQLRMDAARARARGDYAEARELANEAREIEQEIGRTIGRTLERV